MPRTLDELARAMLGPDMPNGAAALLAEAIENTRRECSCAGWACSPDHDLWTLVQSGAAESPYRAGVVDVALLRDLAVLAGGWVVVADDVPSMRRLVPLDEWLPMHDAWREAKR